MASRRLGTTLGALALLAGAALVPVGGTPSAEAAEAVEVPTGLAPLLRDEDQPVVAGFARSIDLARMAAPSRVPVTSYAVEEPEHGHLQGDCSDGFCTYVPDEGHVGPEDLTVTAANSDGTSRPATLRLMTRPNQPPTANDDLQVLDAGAPHTWQIGVSDENGILADGIVVLDGPDHGDLACRAAGCTYLPDPGFVGEDVVTWQADDGLLVSRVATTHLVVRPNLAPVLLDHTLLVASGDSAIVGGEASDPDGAPLTYAVVRAPEHGDVGECHAFGCTYTADPGYVGTDLFTWRASDGRSWSTPAKVLVSVRPSTTARTAGRAPRAAVTTSSVPVAVSDSYGAVAGRPTRLTLNLQPTEGDPVVEIVTPPSHGSITGCTRSVCEYVPEAGFAGADLFVWQATTSDGTTSTAEAHLTVHATGAPEAVLPTRFQAATGATGRIYFSTENSWTGLDRVVIETQPAHGRIDFCSSLVCLYIADPGYTGPDSFTWRADDGEAVSPALTTAVTVVDPENAKVPDVTITALAGRAATIPGTGRIASLPELGELRCRGSVCTYLAAPGVSGTDTFQLVSRVAPAAPRTTVTVKVRPDRAPVAVTAHYLYVERAASFTLPVTDPDEEEDHAFEVQVVRHPQHGLVTWCNSASCSYEPAPGFRGVDEFAWRATDGRNLSAVVTQRVVVGPVTLRQPRVTLVNPIPRPRVGAVTRWTATVRGPALDDLHAATVVWWVPDVLKVERRSLPRGCSVRGRHVRCVLEVLTAGATHTFRLRATPLKAQPATLSVRLRDGGKVLARDKHRIRPTQR